MMDTILVVQNQVKDGFLALAAANGIQIIVETHSDHVLTGKSHLFQQISPYAHLISGGKMFVNNASGQRGLVCQYDVVCFDEISGVSFDQKDGVNILKGYMESGEFSRGKESIRASGGIVMMGNFDMDIKQQQRIGHLLSLSPAAGDAQ